MRFTDDWPFLVVYLFFFAGAMVRSHATYWAGRGLRAGGARTRLARHLDRPAVLRAERFVRRVGAPAVTLAFLTIGVQTAVIAASGALRMPLSRFVPATVVGALAWAAIYTTVGFAVVEAWLGRVSWWWVVGGLALVVLIVVVSRRVAARWDRSATPGGG